MAHVIDFKTVSTAGLETSPVVDALAGLRANEARYFFNNKARIFQSIFHNGRCTKGGRCR